MSKSQHTISVVSHSTDAMLQNCTSAGQYLLETRDMPIKSLYAECHAGGLTLGNQSGLHWYSQHFLLSPAQPGQPA